MNIAELEKMTLPELHEIKATGHSRSSQLQKQALTFEITKAAIQKEGALWADGILEVLPEGFGFLRVGKLTPTSDDIYISPSQIRRFSLRKGDMVSGQVRPPKDAEKYFALLRVEAVNGLDPELAARRSHFEDLVPVYPDYRLKLEHDSKDVTTRLIDLMAPIGKGQRGLICISSQGGKNYDSEENCQRPYT